jgi:hypothetical protein
MPDPIIDDLQDMFPDTILWEKFLSSSGFGRDVFQSPQSLPASISKGIDITLNIGGREKVSSVQVIIGGYYGLSVKDRYTLPARFAPLQQPPAVSVISTSDENGPHHETVYF